MRPHVVLEKQVGETPLSCLEAYRSVHPELKNTPMAYAGRLDPMASGKLLVLIGDECKVQERYHNLDKEYEFQILFGVQSDSQDVLGIVEAKGPRTFDSNAVTNVLPAFCGTIALPYPLYSSKTVNGKPLHTWTLEGRANEITVPVKSSQVYALTLERTEMKTTEEIYSLASQKIESIPKVTDERKALGNDFRRDDVRASWKKFIEGQPESTPYTVASFRCICSSGTYMRSLSEAIAEKLGTKGLAFSIRRTKIGAYTPLPFNLGFWRKIYR